MKVISVITLVFILFFMGIGTASLQTKEITNENESGWERVVYSGFGSNENVVAWAMEEYKGYLYVGTRTDVQKCQIHRSFTGDKNTWAQVIEDGFDKNYPSDGVRNMIVYEDLLWAVTDSWKYGTQVFVTNGEDDNGDGILNWKKANELGFGKGNTIQSSRSLLIYNGKLHVGARSNERPYIFRYDGPTDFEFIQPKNWSLINDGMVNNPSHNPLLILPGKMINFTAQDGKDYIYIGLYEEPVPLFERFMQIFDIRDLIKFITYPFWKCELWRYDGENWDEVVEDGFGNINVAAISAIVLNNTLYFGTSNVIGIEIWKTTDGENWTQMVKRIGNQPLTMWCWRMHIFNDRLIIGTFNPIIGAELWASTDDNPMSNDDFYKIDITDLNKNSFPFFLQQDGIRCFETFKGDLYVGTTLFLDFIIKRFHGNGCEVWRIDHIPEAG